MMRGCLCDKHWRINLVDLPYLFKHVLQRNLLIRYRYCRCMYVQAPKLKQTGTVTPGFLFSPLLSLLWNLPIVMFTRANVTVTNQLVVLLHQHMKLMCQTMHLRFQLRHGLRHRLMVLFFEMLRMHWSIGLMPAGCMRRESLLLVFVAEGFV